MEYYINIGNEKRGPYSLNELESRNITAETLVMPADGDTWTPAWQIEELRPLIKRSEGRAGSPGSSAQAARQEGGEAHGSYGQQGAQAAEGEQIVDAEPIINGRPRPIYEQPEQRPSSHWGCLVGFIVSLLLFIGLLALTCPTEQDHRNALTNVITDAITDEVPSDSAADNDIFTKAMGMLGDAFTRQVVQKAVDNMVHVDNFTVVSIGRVRYNHKRQIVSVGLLNHVFTVNKEDLKQAAEKNLKSNVEAQIREKVVNPFTNALQQLMKSALSDPFGLGNDDDPSSPDEDEVDTTEAL